MHNLQSVIAARVARDRAAGLQVMLGMSPTVLTGLRTDIDLPPWVASACGLTQNTASFQNACLRSEFIADATTYAAALQPEYFHLATEINTLLLRKIANPADNEFVFFSQLYQSAVPAVKSVTPNVKLFVSFQYDLQKKVEEDNPGSWDSVLTPFRGAGTSLLDFVGYTTYPSSSPFLGSDHYSGPWAMPADYYAAAGQHLQAPERVVFSEIGWPSRGSGTESEQKTFLDRLPELMSPAHPALATWALLHDVPSNSSLFLNLDLATVGLRNCDGSAKPGWAVLSGAAGQGSGGSPLAAVQVFPNPLRFSAGHSAMHFTGLPAGARVRIYTLQGERVRDLAGNEFGSATWDGANQSGRRTASGIYVVYIQGGGGTRSFKVAVQR